MRKYRVTVNGTVYEVELEEITGAVPAAAEKPVALHLDRTAAKQLSKAENPAPAAPAGEGERITSPMPGTILSVNVTPGQSVKKGDVLMILEAMKMENEIMCPRDGVVASVQAAKGAAVESGTLLCVLQ